MKYFHRTSLAPDDVMSLADRHFGARLTAATQTARNRLYKGTLGEVTVAVRPEGGHYVRITAVTDQVGESELDKVTKKFLALIHQRVDKTHEVRGAY